MNLQRLEHIHWLAILGYALAVLLNLCMPGLHLSLEPLLTGYERIYYPAWIAWVAVSSATCASIGALLNRPLKYRLPTGAFAVAGLIFALGAGELLAKSHASPAMWPGLLLGALAYLMGFGFFSYYGRTWQWSLDLVVNLPIRNDRRTNHSKQISIRYLLVATTLIAITLALVQLLAPHNRFSLNLVGMAFTIVLGSVFLFALVPITIAILHLALNDALELKKQRLWLLVLGVLSSPLAIWLLMALFASASGQPSSTPSAHAMADLFVFLGCYATVLWSVMHVLSLAGLRLVRRC